MSTTSPYLIFRLAIRYEDYRARKKVMERHGLIHNDAEKRWERIGEQGLCIGWITDECLRRARTQK